MKIINETSEQKTIEACSMKENQLGIVISGQYAGLHIFRGYDTLVALEGGETWNTRCTLEVRLLPPGTRITLEVQEVE